MAVQKKIKDSHIEAEDAYRKVLYWYFAHPEKGSSLNDVANQTGIAKTTARSTVTRLVEEGFLKLERLGNLWHITCNQAHTFNTTRKIPYNLQLVYESGIINLIHQEFPHCQAIILFGSYRKGDDHEKSDLDIAILVNGWEGPSIIELGTIRKFGHRENVTVQVHVVDKRKIDNLNLFANIANGIVLEGFLEVRP